MYIEEPETGLIRTTAYRSSPRVETVRALKHCRTTVSFRSRFCFGFSPTVASDMTFQYSGGSVADRYSPFKKSPVNIQEIPVLTLCHVSQRITAQKGTTIMQPLVRPINSKDFS